MSLLKWFSGPTPDKLERDGDSLSAAHRWGDARQAYARAYSKLEKDLDNSQQRARITEKIARTGDALAREHQAGARHYADGGHDEDARELLVLAVSLASDGQLKHALQEELDATEERIATTLREQSLHISYNLEEIETETDANSPFAPDQEFFALCQTLPDEVRDAYLGYGEAFQLGYLALNQGDFANAVIYLKQAMEEHSHPRSYIPLELATAYANLNQASQAQSLLEAIIGQHSDLLPAYQLLCEIYWENEDFDSVDGLLANLPEDLTQSLAVTFLKGENLMRSQRYEDARQFFEDFIKRYGWHDNVAIELAKAYEALNQMEDAHSQYEQIINRCSSCHQNIDPTVKHKFAELSYAMGERDTALLEIYLTLARELPLYKALYFDRVSRIYAHQGHPEQAQRFRVLANGKPQQK